MGEMNTNQQRHLFLEELERDLGTTGGSLTAVSRQESGARRRRPLARPITAGAALVAALGSLAVLAPPALASTPPSRDNGAVNVVNAARDVRSPLCDVGPHAEPRGQSYWCGLTNWVYNYLREYGTPSGAVCYVFDLTVYGNCAGTVHVGEKTACTVG